MNTCFKKLYDFEQSALGGRRREDFYEVTPPGSAQEPRVRHTSIDRVGLALSGGGIRSATFNLGLLEGLQDLDLLHNIDYLATVSGGGYIGGWWSAWLSRRTSAGDGLFPKTVGLEPEPEEVRHLREFSNFLAPRVGFFETETWNAVIAIVSSSLPALAAALAVISLGLCAWLLLAFSSMQLHPLLIMLGLPVVIGMLLEANWGWWKASENVGLAIRAYAVFLLISLPIIGALAWTWPRLFEYWTGSRWAVYVPGTAWNAGWLPYVPDTTCKWWWSIGIPPDPGRPCLNPRLFDPTIIWLAATLPLMLLRLVVSRFSRIPRHTIILPAIDRTMERLLAMGLVWAILGLLWTVGCHLQQFIALLIALTVSGGGSFAWLRQLIGANLKKGKKGHKSEKAKANMIQALAYATLGLTVVLISSLLGRCCGSQTVSWLLAAVASLGVIVLALIAFDPAELSLHSFYRSRIVRTYLGASNRGGGGGNCEASQNRQTDVRQGDDILLKRMRKMGCRPLHLICCAANDVSGDTLPTLSRGARSAVLSCIGFSMGDCWQTRTNVTLGSALTASAAAFNSNMGSLSMSLGSAVTFLMTALNLRLGLWTPNPAGDRFPWSFIPGAFFFLEMFGLTDAGMRSGSSRRLRSRHVHLSDGAHFENLALYELIRRHCRYIIVSDCGCDPEAAFDDLGNALRRIREDFGVEIELDLAPLRPDTDGRSRQHMVVGTIHYDPATKAGLDKGILLYFKPTLTGDEPGDVLQYKTRNAVFPQEGTSDQFYDEAQWESYRRLGKHALRSGLRFLSSMGRGDSRPSPQEIFSGAREEWYPGSEAPSHALVKIAEECAELEHRLRTNGPAALVQQVFPELVLCGAPAAALSAPAAVEPVVHILLQVMQLMEDLYLLGNMGTRWNSPSNRGWGNYLHRWASTPAFRMWWPILKPMYNPRFRRFMEDHFQLPTTEASPLDAYCLTSSRTGAIAGSAWKAWQRVQPRNDLSGLEMYAFDLKLKDSAHTPPQEHCIQVAASLVRILAPAAEWQTDDLFVLPGLWGSGIGTEFVRHILEDLRKRGISECQVKLDTSRRLSSEGSRAEHLDHVEFYRSLGFCLDREGKRLLRSLS